MTNESRTLVYWQSMRMICDRVIATLERRNNYPMELHLPASAGLRELAENVTMIERIMRIKFKNRIAS